MTPSYLAYKALRTIRRACPIDRCTRLTCHLSPALLMAGACVLFFRLAAPASDRDRGGAVSADLGAGLVRPSCSSTRARPTPRRCRRCALTWLVERTLALGERRRTRRPRLARRRRGRARSTPSWSTCCFCRCGRLRDLAARRAAIARSRVRARCRWRCCASASRPRSRCGTTTSRPARSSTPATRSRTASSRAISSPALYGFLCRRERASSSTPRRSCSACSALRTALAPPPRRDRCSCSASSW